MAEKARTLHKKADAAKLAVLIFEAMLIGSAGSATVGNDDDPLADAATLYKVDANAIRIALAKEEKTKAQKKNRAASGKEKPARKTKATRK